jgi:hypothetical protein
MVVSAAAAQAAERWPDGPCRDLQNYERSLDKLPGAPSDKALQKVPLLILEGSHCGIDVDAKLAAASNVAQARPAPVGVVPDLRAKRHTDCTTLRIDRDLATTQCD